MCVCVCVFLLNTPSGGKSCLVVPGVAVPHWATETVFSGWWGQDITRAFTSCMMNYENNFYMAKSESTDVSSNGSSGSHSEEPFDETSVDLFLAM